MIVQDIAAYKKQIHAQGLRLTGLKLTNDQARLLYEDLTKSLTPSGLTNPEEYTRWVNAPYYKEKLTQETFLKQCLHEVVMILGVRITIRKELTVHTPWHTTRKVHIPLHWPSHTKFDLRVHAVPNRNGGSFVVMHPDFTPELYDYGKEDWEPVVVDQDGYVHKIN